MGSGVAGLAAARRLSLAGCSAVLISPFRAVPARGETLSAQALRSFDALGWSGLLAGDVALASEGRFSIWGDGVLRRSDVAEAGFHVDRPRLEAAMAASITNGKTECRVASVTELEHRPDGIRVSVSDGSVIDASAVIDCSGRAALSSGTSSNRRRLDRLVAACRILELPDDAEVAAVTLVEAVEAGWWYVAPMPRRRLVLGLYTDSDLLPSGTAQGARAWADRLGETLAVAARLDSLGLEGAASAAPPEIAAAASVPAARLLEGRILRAGDAAAAMDPLAANGLATALWSGLRAAEACLAMMAGEAAAPQAYERAFLEGIARQGAHQRAVYATERRFPDAPFWSRRQSRHCDGPGPVGTENAFA